MDDQLERLRRLVGDAKIERLRNSKVIVFGIGGVGGYVVEALARSGVGELAIVDSDRVCLSNLNRQIYALHSTLEELKVDVA
ncbi:MAG: ThiF family adenylyltransferase, partial [Spirochaetales bacterium]|nr:ThiF family adenylyltransferase [Spirochaetales bacterium]